MTGVLKVGVIGAGRMGVRHARILNRMSETHLAAVAETDAAKRKALAEELGIREYRDAHELLAKEAPDAVVVATSDSQHFTPCRAALEAGVAVLVEKPIATDISEAQTLVDLSERLGVLLMPGHLFRFDPTYEAVAEKVHAGELGEVAHIFARRTHARRTDRTDGVPSAAVMVGIHDIDIFNWLLGSRPLSVTAVARQAPSSRSQDGSDAVMALLRFPGNAFGAIEASRLIPPGRPIAVDFELEVVGLAGAIWLRAADSGIEMVSNGISTRPNLSFGEWGWDLVLERELSAFLGAVRGEREAAISGRHGLDALRIAMAIDAAAASGEAVAIE